jgi:8-oxo-dGTP diphosphatase
VLYGVKMNITAPDYKFCPFCGTHLETRSEEGLQRKFCPKDKWTYYPKAQCSAAAIVIRDSKIVIRDSKILLVKRAKNPHIGKWMAPAGFLNFVEDPRAAALREVEEETGYKGLIATLYDYRQVTAEEEPREPGHYVFVFIVEIEKNPGNISDTEENLEVRWFDIKQLPEMAFPTQHKVILDIINDFYSSSSLDSDSLVG